MRLPNCDFTKMLGAVSREFKARKCRQEVSAEMTTETFLVDGVECQMVVEIKVYPVTTGNVVPIKRSAR
jgi:hypothetical protein